MDCATKTFDHCRGKKSKVVGPKLDHKFFFSVPMIFLQFSVAFIGIFLVQIWDILFQKTQKNAISFKKMVVFKTNKKPRKTAGIWCRLSDLNQRPTDYKSAALPAELNRRCPTIIHISKTNASKKIIIFLPLYLFGAKYKA